MGFEFIDRFLGQELDQTLRFVIAFGVVILLIFLVTWLFKKLFHGGLGVHKRGRVARLAVLEAIAIDQRRRLVLVRRDNTEHLVLIGGTNDLVVEQGIQRVARSQAQRPGAGRVSEPNFDTAPASPPRPAAPHPERAAPPASQRPAQPAPQPPAGARVAQPQPQPQTTVPAAAPAPRQGNDQLAGMAEKLEAALRLPVQSPTSPLPPASADPVPVPQQPEATDEDQTGLFSRIKKRSAE